MSTPAARLVDQPIEREAPPHPRTSGVWRVAAQPVRRAGPWTAELHASTLSFYGSCASLVVRSDQLHTIDPGHVSALCRDLEALGDKRLTLHLLETWFEDFIWDDRQPASQVPRASTLLEAVRAAATEEAAIRRSGQTLTRRALELGAALWRVRAHDGEQPVAALDGGALVLLSGRDVLLGLSTQEHPAADAVQRSRPPEESVRRWHLLGQATTDPWDQPGVTLSRAQLIEWANAHYPLESAPPPRSARLCAALLSPQAS